LAEGLRHLDGAPFFNQTIPGLIKKRAGGGRRTTADSIPIIKAPKAKCSKIFLKSMDYCGKTVEKCPFKHPIFKL
jgi:hypothetical protein